MEDSIKSGFKTILVLIRTFTFFKSAYFKKSLKHAYGNQRRVGYRL